MLIVTCTTSSTKVIRLRSKYKGISECSDEPTRAVLLEVVGIFEGNLYRYNLFWLIMLVVITVGFMVGVCIITILNHIRPSEQKV